MSNRFIFLATPDGDLMRVWISAQVMAIRTRNVHGHGLGLPRDLWVAFDDDGEIMAASLNFPTVDPEGVLNSLICVCRQIAEVAREGLYLPPGIEVRSKELRECH